MTGRTQAPYMSTSPATGEVVARFDPADDAQVERALATAEAAYRTWSEVPLADRAAAALRIADLFEERADVLARLATLEMGKPLAEAVEEVEFCVSIFRYYGEHGPGLVTDQPLEISGGDAAVVQRRPLGVLLGVMPWNFPFYQVARFAAPNLVLGNSVLLKPAESVPQCALAIQEIFDSADVPTGVYRNVFATFEQVESVVADPRVQGVSLTGSDRAGATIASLAGRHLKKCVLELGGSDPYVVLDADDVAQAAIQAWQTRLYNTGQACNSNKRIIVAADLFEEFVATLVDQARGLRPGDPGRPTPSTYAPMSSRAAAVAVAAQVMDAVSLRATLHVGGELGEGAYFAPAVLTGVTPQMRAYREELFGPVAVVYAADSDDEAVRIANDCDYGLGAAVFSTDPERARRVASRLEAGMVNVNTPAGEGAEIPFGGVKRSGFGRELGPLGMDEFANKRLFYVRA